MGCLPVSFDGHESVETHDPHALLFGDDHDDLDEHDPLDEPRAADIRPVRGERRRRRRRRRQFGVLLAALLIIVVAVSGIYAYHALYAPKDWTGDGTGTVLVQVHSGDGADAIADTLVTDGVVRSSAAFTSAAAANSKASSIQPGFYRLRRHMSGTSALNLMLDSSSHIVNKFTIPEGTIEKDIISKLATALNVPESQVQSAASDIANLGLPDGYSPASGPLTSAEGFLYPDTYQLDPGMSPSDALQMMTSEFTTQDKSNGFADGAKKLGITPYSALIIASIAQSEVKSNADAPKVARVILNRLAANMPLQIDATSAYAAKLQGLDPAKVVYATIDSPYNSYTHPGLPPTPINSPGQPALAAAVAPAAGDWLYYVNGDANGDLAFFNNDTDFEAAVQKCRANNWGCGT